MTHISLIAVHSGLLLESYRIRSKLSSASWCLAGGSAWGCWQPFYPRGWSASTESKLPRRRGRRSPDELVSALDLTAPRLLVSVLLKSFRMRFLSFAPESSDHSHNAPLVWYHPREEQPPLPFWGFPLPQAEPLSHVAPSTLSIGNLTISAFLWGWAKRGWGENNEGITLNIAKMVRFPYLIYFLLPFYWNTHEKAENRSPETNEIIQGYHSN